jgi:tetratricopeptide (TPR) repeat protein
MTKTLLLLFLLQSVCVLSCLAQSSDKNALIAQGHEFYEQGQWKKALNAYKSAGCGTPQICPPIVTIRMAASKKKITLFEKKESQLVAEKRKQEEEEIKADSLENDQKQVQASFQQTTEQWLKGLANNQQRKEESILKANVWFNKGKEETSDDRKIDHFTKAIQLNAQMKDAYFFRGSAYYNKGNTISALGDFEKVKHMDPKDANNWRMLGEVHLKETNTCQAVKDLKKALQLDINLESAKKSLAIAEATFRNNIVIHKSWVDSAAVVNNEKGVKIHLRWSLNGMQNQRVQAVAYFFTGSGEKLKDKDKKYCTGDGQVSTSSFFTSSDINDLELFLPYQQFDVSETGKYVFKYVIRLRNSDCNFLFQSDYSSINYLQQ